MATERVVVLGGGYAGVLAAIRLSGRAPGVAVTLVDAAERLVERVRLHQLAAGQPEAAHRYDELLAGTGVRFVRGRASAIDPERRTVTVDGRALEWDRLIVALGSAVETARVPGVAEHCHTLGPSSAEALRALLPALAARTPGGRVIVCGGGLTGVEAASELAESFPSLAVTLLTSGEVGPDLSPGARGYLRAALARLGVRVEEHVSVEEVRAASLRAGGREHPFDACVWTGGLIASPLARAAGLACDDLGRALTDECLRSLSHPRIYLAGDAGVPRDRPHGMACASAMPMGAHAADNVAAAAAGRPERTFRFGYLLRCISLGRRDGLVQLLRPSGAARATFFTGRPAAWLKERICRYTIWSLRVSRRWAGFYRWPHGARPALPPADDRKRLAA